MKKILLITHCYAAKYSHYAAMLRYQLSSLVLYPPKKCSVEIAVCYSLDDKETVKVINEFSKYPFLNMILFPMDVRYLGRRSIGRNWVSTEVKSDIVWFTDVDHFFYDCLDCLSDFEWPEDVSMVYPKIIQIHKTHELGDQATKQISDTVKFRDINKIDFTDKKYTRAIGGVQIVKGDFAKKYGYLDGFKKWQKPTKTPFSDFRDDIAYRKFCSKFGRILPIDLPRVFRLRHSQTTYGK